MEVKCQSSLALEVIANASKPGRQGLGFAWFPHNIVEGILCVCVKHQSSLRQTGPPTPQRYCSKQNMATSADGVKSSAATAASVQRLPCLQGTSDEYQIVVGGDSVLETLAHVQPPHKTHAGGAHAFSWTDTLLGWDVVVLPAAHVRMFTTLWLPVHT